MKKIIRLSESDLIKLVKRVINEQPSPYDIPELTNISRTLLDLGFKFSRTTTYGTTIHTFKYQDGENIITVNVNPDNSSKPYSVVSILLKPNYVANPGYEKSKFDRTYTDIDKDYSKDQYNLLISDVKSSLKKIKPTV